MKNKNKWKALFGFVGILFVSFSFYFGYALLNTDKASDSEKEPAVAEERENQDAKAAKFAEGSSAPVNDYENVGSFISQMHEWYNQKLGWGRIDAVKWGEQKDKAAELRLIIGSIETKNTDLQSDFKTISNYASDIENGEKDKKTLLKLHRFFHDLDIEYNGYKQSKDYYDITEYKNKRG
ncbi:hypothetical protein [Bacillus sp. T33-2]|uniref:hypothetical protein n=1 Tax=Bacillus sp. T33-2 TaxID=2054168 RepID=UPI000C77D474|nr:hypothetical protein [Bacillus sp. T33-2]PLR98838.1 hypothetical protein CVD19_04180 [Bacillus sp. T33-2]